MIHVETEIYRYQHENDCTEVESTIHVWILLERMTTIRQAKHYIIDWNEIADANSLLLIRLLSFDDDGKLLKNLSTKNTMSGTSILDDLFICLINIRFGSLSQRVEPDYFKALLKKTLPEIWTVAWETFDLDPLKAPEDIVVLSF